MAEYKNPQESLIDEGHCPNTSNTVLELYRLLAVFLASKGFATLLTDNPGKGFDPIYEIQAVEGDEITRLLLNLAITARVIDDRARRIDDREAHASKLTGFNCGQLQRNLETQDMETLDLREACNKIIHAKKVRHDLEADGGQTYLNPFIYLYGKQNGKDWKATLDIVDFAKGYISLVCGYY